mgnify:CR=1 FL=1
MISSSTTPYISGGDFDGINKGVIYTMSLMEKEDDIFCFCGDGDYKSILIKISKSSIFKPIKNLEVGFLNKYVGHSVPEKWLNRPSFMRINALVPIVLLSALVGVQTFTNKKELVFDQRFAGVIVALIALRFKAPFPVVVVSAAITSAAIYNWF